GQVIGFSLTWPGQEHGPLWITGDTVHHRALRRAATRIQPGTLLLHLGAVAFPLTGPLRYSMTAHQALRLCETISPHTILPVHYEGWQHFRQGRDGIEHDLLRAPRQIGDRFHWLPRGSAEQVRI
ncbi:hypothetical protein, partial [Streptosporangium sp. NPDC002524]|uniref:hypothetical protein n=1 Tax=Streptosporangium sp. NPDC002524 TaxID=3154537 RepID=UPI003317B2AD